MEFLFREGDLVEVQTTGDPNEDKIGKVLVVNSNEKNEVLVTVVFENEEDDDQEYEYNQYQLQLYERVYGTDDDE
ncbi:hypothetical protein ACT7C6_08495 [Bacillus paranthracis]|uniref:hypothetical protein n=1 Tax=Bacillus cereus group sp. TH160LC TaxID=3018058 RepID=UPI0022E28B9C|nr:hypothetical protein [Bacillus cereus group sp. TH160LC]MDA1651124.1 hypothetical protein [Bacillus cereus group sp. TH160LC]